MVLALAALPQAGCPTRLQRVSINEAITKDAVRFIVIGATTMADVVHRLGAPNEMQDSPDGVVFRYRFLDTRYLKVIPTWGLGFAFPVLNFVPSDLYSVELSTGGMGTDEFQIMFDHDWKASAFAFARHARASQFVPLPVRPPAD